MVFIRPRFEDIRAYYRDGQYRSQHEHTPGKTLTVEERGRLQFEFAKRTAMTFRKDIPIGSSVLDVGCSAGGFLAQIGPDYDRYGLEWNAEDAAYVRDVGEIPCEENDITECFPGRTFSAISLIQVLEHQPDPVDFLRKVRERLMGGGWLFIEVPNIRDALLSMYKLEPFAQFYFREPHITYWAAETIAALMNITGFEARISLFQRYNMQNHLNWILNGVPMDDPRMAQHAMLPVPKGNPGAPALNRIWDQIAAEYRVQMETLYCADTLRIVARRRQI